MIFCGYDGGRSHLFNGMWRRVGNGGVARIVFCLKKDLSPIDSSRLSLAWGIVLLFPLQFMLKIKFLTEILEFGLISRCQIAVHQECYGARSIRDFTSWVCRACETPQHKRECCLCPVKGTCPEIWIFSIYHFVDFVYNLNTLMSSLLGSSSIQKIWSCC